MALPLSNAAEDEDEELVHGFDAAGYAQLPADHLSDSSESSNGASCDLAWDPLSMSLQVEYSATFDTVDAVTHSHNSTPHLSGACNGMEIQDNENIKDSTLYQNDGHVTHIDGMENQAASESVVNESSHQNGNHVTHADGMENQGLASISNIVHIDGMEIHVYGQLAGLQLSSHTLNNHDDGEDIDDQDDVDESERQRAEDAAFQRAKEADVARRLAPLPPDRLQAIKKAMQSISLGGFQPEWADKVPEEQWVNRLRRKSMSKSIKN